MLILIFVTISWFFVWFNRDPDRNVPKRTGIIVSPSDGRVLYVEEFSAGNMPVPKKFGRNVILDELTEVNAFPLGGYLIGIYLSPFDVHVTRAPISGKILFTRHFKGRLFSRKLFSLEIKNEHSTSVIQSGNTTIGIIQIATYFVRRVVMNTVSGDEVGIGDRIGKIRLGSQVDLILSNTTSMKVVVKPDDKVRAGESTIATIEDYSV